MVLFRPSRVLLLDEPEQRLDTHKRGLLTDILLARKAAGAALVVACHDPDHDGRDRRPRRRRRRRMSEAPDASDVAARPTTDRERLAEARRVIRGGLPEEGNGNAVYAAYVAVIASLVYGVPASRAFFEFVDPAWLSRHLTGVQGVLVVGAIVAALAAARTPAGLGPGTGGARPALPRPRRGQRARPRRRAATLVAAQPARLPRRRAAHRGGGRHRHGRRRGGLAVGPATDQPRRAAGRARLRRCVAVGPGAVLADRRAGCRNGAA